MNIVGFIISLLLFLFAARLTYEVWFKPKQFIKRMDAYRNSWKDFLGFSYWNNGYVNWPMVKAVSIFLLIIFLLSLIVSITGPITY